MRENQLERTEVFAGKNRSIIEEAGWVRFEEAAFGGLILG